MDFNPNRSCIFFFHSKSLELQHINYIKVIQHHVILHVRKTLICRILKITKIKKKREMEEGGREGWEAGKWEGSKFTLRKTNHRLLFRSGKPVFKKTLSCLGSIILWITFQNSQPLYLDIFLLLLRSPSSHSRIPIKYMFLSQYIFCISYTRQCFPSFFSLILQRSSFWSFSSLLSNLLLINWILNFFVILFRSGI